MTVKEMRQLLASLPACLDDAEFESDDAGTYASVQLTKAFKDETE